MSATDLEHPAVASSGTRIEEADIAAAESLGRHRHHPAIRSLGAASEIADQAPAFALSGALAGIGLLAGRPKLAEAGTRMLASTLVATAIKSVVKGLVSRARPTVLLDEGRYGFEGPRDDGGPWHSFPSGHTADAVAGARALARVYPGASAPAYVLAAAIGAIQIPRAKHYPLDVAVGALVGVVSEIVVEVAWRAVEDKLYAGLPDFAQDRRVPLGRPITAS